MVESSLNEGLLTPTPTPSFTILYYQGLGEPGISLPHPKGGLCHVQSLLANDFS